MKVKRGYHGGDEKHSIATDDVYNVHFIKRTKVVVLKDRRGATFNIPLNSAVQFAPVFNPSNDPREPAKGASFEKVSDLISLKTLPTVVRATKPHIRVDSKSTVEQSELFIVQSVVPLSVRKKALKVYSITCNQEKLLLPDSMGAFSTDPSIACLYLLEIMEHFLNRLPLDVRVVLSNCDVIREELPFYLTNEVATLSHLDSEISLIASTNWGENEVVCEEGQMPVEIPVDLPIQLVVQTPDGAREAHLSHHTKRLYERFDPSRIRLLKTRNIRRGFEKEGMELQRPERIYDIPDVSTRRNRSPQAVGGASVSPQLRPRLATPESCVAADPAYSKTYQPLMPTSGAKKGSRKSEYTAPEPHRSTSPSSPAKTISRDHRTPASSSSRGSQSPRSDRRNQGQLPLPAPVSGGSELLENRVEILEREVHALRAEIAKLKTLVASSASALPEDQRMSSTRRNNIQHLNTLSTKQVGDLLERMKLSQYREIFAEQEITGAILSQCTTEVLKMELGVASRIHRLRLLQIVTGEISADHF
jgi:hypothetical protein